jgi:hypothetical protein
MTPPQLRIEYETFPEDVKERHELFVDILGQYLFWLRNTVLKFSKELAESPETRMRLGRMHRALFEKLSQLESDQRTVAYELATTCIDNFARELLRLIGNEGTDLRLGDRHAIRFRLDIEVCDIESGEVVEQMTISKGGRKFLPEYWGQWLNRYNSI